MSCSANDAWTDKKFKKKGFCYLKRNVLREMSSQGALEAYLKCIGNIQLSDLHIS